MEELISRNAAIKAMLNEQQDDIKAYGCSIPEGFDGFCNMAERRTDETD